MIRFMVKFLIVLLLNPFLFFSGFVKRDQQTFYLKNASLDPSALPASDFSF